MHSLSQARKLLAAALASAFVLATPGAWAQNAQESDVHEISEGTVAWGVKQSWRDYIGPNGVTASGGITVNEAGTYDIPIASGTINVKTGALQLDLEGTLRWRSYCSDPEPGKEEEPTCLLDSTITDLSVDINSEEQVIRGTYKGYAREDPGGTMEEYPNQVLAVLDISESFPAEVDGETFWSDIPASAGEGLVLYERGTKIDPVTITYTGPAKRPSVAQEFMAQNAPVLEADGNWYGFNDSSRSSYSPHSQSIYANNDKNRVYALDFDTKDGEFGSRRGVTFRTFSQDDLSPVGKEWSAVLPEDDTEVFTGLTAYAESLDAFYFISKTDEFISETNSGAGARVWVAKFNDHLNRFLAVKLVDIEPEGEDDIVDIRAMKWDPQRERLALVNSKRSTEKGGVDLDQYEMIWINPLDTQEMDRVDINMPPPPGESGEIKLSRFILGDGLRATWAIATDGSYIFPGNYYGPTDSSKATPVLRIYFDEQDSPNLEWVENSYPREEGKEGAAFRNVFEAADGSIYLGGSWTAGRFSVLNIVDGKAVVDPVRVTYTNGPLDAFFGAGDSANGVNYYFDGSTNTVSVIKDHQRVSFVEVENFQAFNGGFNNIVAGNDGSVFIRIKDYDTKHSSIRKFSVAGYTPTITQDPADVEVVLSDDATEQVSFEVSSNGSSDTVQWQVLRPGATVYTDVDGGTSETLRFDATAEDANARYRAVVKNEFGSVVSRPAQLTVHRVPRFIQQPKDIEAREGSDASFIAVSDPAIEAQQEWQIYDNGKWRAVNDADKVTVDGGQLVVEATPERNGQQYRSVLTNAYGEAISNEVSLTVKPADELRGPSVVEQPAIVEVEVGTTVAFTSRGDGNPLPTVQWQTRTVSSAGAGDWENVVGATNETLEVTADAPGTFEYRAVFTNEHGSVASDPARLKVVLPKEDLGEPDDPSTKPDAPVNPSDGPATLADPGYPGTDDAESILVVPGPPSTASVSESTSAAQPTDGTSDTPSGGETSGGNSITGGGSSHETTASGNAAKDVGSNGTSTKPQSGDLAATGNSVNPALIAVLAFGLISAVLGGGMYVTRKRNSA